MRYVENYRISQQSIWSILFQILFLQISGLAKAFISAYQVLCAYFRSLGGHWSTMELACQFWQGRLQHNEIQLCLQDWSNWTAIPCQGWFVSSYHSFSSLQALCIYIYLDLYLICISRINICQYIYISICICICICIWQIL